MDSTYFVPQIIMILFCYASSPQTRLKATRGKGLQEEKH